MQSLTLEFAEITEDGLAQGVHQRDVVVRLQLNQNED